MEWSHDLSMFRCGGVWELSGIVFCLLAAAIRTYTAEFGAWLCNLFDAHGLEHANLPAPRNPPDLDVSATDLELFMKHCVVDGALVGDLWADAAYRKFYQAFNLDQLVSPRAICTFFVFAPLSMCF